MGILNRFFGRSGNRETAVETPPKEVTLEDFEASVSSRKRNVEDETAALSQKLERELSLRLSELDKHLAVLESENLEGDIHPRVRAILLYNKRYMTSRLRQALERARDGGVAVAQRELAETVKATELNRLKIADYMNIQSEAVASRPRNWRP